LAVTGFVVQQVWTDDDRDFAVLLARQTWCCNRKADLRSVGAGRDAVAACSISVMRMSGDLAVAAGTTPALTRGGGIPALGVQRQCTGTAGRINNVQLGVARRYADDPGRPSSTRRCICRSSAPATRSGGEGRCTRRRRAHQQCHQRTGNPAGLSGR